jgi:hypothetical protein
MFSNTMICQWFLAFFNFTAYLPPSRWFCLLDRPHCCLAGLEEWGDDAVLNQVLAVSQQEYLNSLKQQQETDTHNKVNNIITSLFFHSVIATVPVQISAESENYSFCSPETFHSHLALFYRCGRLFCIYCTHKTFTFTLSFIFPSFSWTFSPLLLSPHIFSRGWFLPLVSFSCSIPATSAHVFLQ